MARQKKEKEWRRLPDGKLTQSLKKYLNEWRWIYEPIQRAYGLKIGGFDPGFLFFRVNGDGEVVGPSVDIPLWLAKKMAYVAEQAEAGQAAIEEAAGASL